MSTDDQRRGVFVPPDCSVIRFVDSSSESEEGNGKVRDTDERVETPSAHSNNNSLTDDVDSSDSGINTTYNASGTIIIGEIAERPFPIHNLASAEDDDCEFEGQLGCALALAAFAFCQLILEKHFQRRLKFAHAPFCEPPISRKTADTPTTSNDKSSPTSCGNNDGSPRSSDDEAGEVRSRVKSGASGVTVYYSAFSNSSSGSSDVGEYCSRSASSCAYLSAFSSQNNYGSGEGYSSEDEEFTQTERADSSIQLGDYRNNFGLGRYSNRNKTRKLQTTNSSTMSALSSHNEKQNPNGPKRRRTTSESSSSTMEDELAETTTTGSEHPRYSGIGHLLETDAPLFTTAGVPQGGVKHTTKEKEMDDWTMEQASSLPPPIVTHGIEATATTEESPPIQVVTVGVQREQIIRAALAEAEAARERRRHQALESERDTDDVDSSPQTDHHRRHFMDGGSETETDPTAGYLYFGERVYAASEEDEDDDVETAARCAAAEGATFNVAIPPFGFLDAIIEEESDDLRSAQSSRASQPHTPSQRSSQHQFHSTSTESSGRTASSEESGGGGADTATPFSRRFFTVLRAPRQYTREEEPEGGVRIEELSSTSESSSTPEEEGWAADEEQRSPSFVPRLDLSESKEPAARDQTSGDETETEKSDVERGHSAASGSSSSSETTTVLESSVYKPKSRMGDFSERAKMEKPESRAVPEIVLIRTPEIIETMVDADRDQLEVIVPQSDQFSCFTPIEESQVSSTSMSINLDRSREFDDEENQSICSNPQDETALLTGLPAAATISTTSTTIRNGPHGEITTVNSSTVTAMPRQQGDGHRSTVMQTRRNDKSENSATSGSASTRSSCSDEDELPPPPPPPLPPPADLSPHAEAAARSIAQNVVDAAIEELKGGGRPTIADAQAIKRKHLSSSSAESEEARNADHATSTTSGGSERNVQSAIMSTVERRAESHPAESRPPTKRLESFVRRPLYFEPVRPISGTTGRFASFVYGNEEPSVAPEPTQVREIPIQHQPAREDWLADKENRYRIADTAPLSNYTKTTYHDGLCYGDDVRQVPVQHYYSRREPLGVDVDADGPPSVVGGADASPEHIFNSYELRRRRHHSSYTTSNPPPMEAPLPSSYGTKGHNFYDSVDFYGSNHHQYQPLGDELSRDDLMSNLGDPNSGGLLSADHRSRATVREIPIQRSTSAFAPSSSSAIQQPGYAEMTSDGSALPAQSTVYTTSKYPGGGMGCSGGTAMSTGQEEYYRREILTRTLVTRSTEALSAPPPLSRSSPIEHYRALPEPPRDEVSEEYWYKYSRNVEEEERRIRESQERRRGEEEERRRREEELRRRWEQQELEQLERLRREREQMEKELESQIQERERLERERIERDRVDREAAEMRRREEWERIENERRAFEESELEKRRQLERLEKERLERERLERERLEMERLERERQAQEKLEKERMERERIERERIKIERLEIERIERIKREQREKEEKERERLRLDAERIERERLEAERLERERVELERRERELIEIQRREAEQRERERREDELREQRRRLQEQREAELLKQAEREAAEREMQRKMREKIELERLEAIRLEQERIELERLELERRERLRQEDERREQELLDAQLRAKERRDQERLEEQRREQQRLEEERREQMRRQQERREAQERERARLAEEEAERKRIAELEAAAVERRAQRMEEERLLRNRAELERRTEELREMERREAEKRERERQEEERRLAELRDLERRNAEQREAERREAAEREANRRRDDRRSRDRLDMIVKEREERERWEAEQKRLLAEHEAQERRRQALTSKETLERLTRRPYYSRENLTTIGQPEVTTKVERQIIERVDRTLWTSDDLRYPTERSTSAGPLLPPHSTRSTYQQQQQSTSVLDGSPTSFDYESGVTGAGRERIFNPRDDELRRGGSTRTSKYRAKMEKARKEFLSHSNQPDQLQDTVSERFLKSTEDLRRRVEYRGPLLQKFHNGELSRAADLEPPLGASGSSYSRVGPSPYEKEFERLIAKAERSLSRYRSRLNSQPELRDNSGTGGGQHGNSANARNEELHRSKSVLDYESPHDRYSRKDGAPSGGGTEGEQHAEGAQHSRSKSADYLMDQRIREDVAPPENELQKTAAGNYHSQSPETHTTTTQREISEHEMRFRKSVEKLHVPDWYREYGAQQSTAVPDPIGRPSTAATSGIFSGTTTRHGLASYQVSPSSVGAPYANVYSQQPWSYTAGGGLTDASRDLRSPASPPIGGISFPAGMFDKYKDEIEDVRRSRTSIHQTGLPEHTKNFSHETIPKETVTREYSREAFSKTDIHTVSTTNASALYHHQHQPGYTVSTVPNEWNLSRNRNSRVIEVADTFVGRPEILPNKGISRYGGRITVEEVLDSIFQETPPEEDPIDPSLPQLDQQPPPNADGPGIYTPNCGLMEKLIEQPQLTEQLVKREDLFVRCSHCYKTRSIREGRGYYVSCKHCYTYYCSRDCRQRDWPQHRDRCSFARINTLCKEVIMKVRRDAETQFHMSNVAREGFKREGRGSVNIRLISAHSAKQYLEKGWKVFQKHDANQLLFYYEIKSLIEQNKEPSLIQLCRKYNPAEKFILSVSIIADIEQCPETPPPEPLFLYQQPFYQHASSDSNPPIPLTSSGTIYHPYPPQPQQHSYGAIVPTNV